MTRGLSCSIRVARFDAAGVGVGSLFGQWGGHILSGCLGLLQSCRGRRGEDGRTGLIARAGAASDGAGKLDNASRRTEHPEHKQTHQPASLVEEIKPHFSCAEYFARGGLRHPRSPPGGRASHQGARHRGHAATSRRVTGRRVPGLGPFFSWISRARAATDAARGAASVQPYYTHDHSRARRFCDSGVSELVRFHGGRWQARSHNQLFSEDLSYLISKSQVFSKSAECRPSAVVVYCDLSTLCSLFHQVKHCTLVVLDGRN
jgi:hypothetical protein